jgi:general stress protein 26
MKFEREITFLRIKDKFALFLSEKTIELCYKICYNLGMDKQVLIENAEKLLAKSGVCSVASITKDGYPRICSLVPLKTTGIKTFWFSTGSSSAKTTQFRDNSKAGVTFDDGQYSVTLTGNMEIVEDKKEKRLLWQDWLFAHFAGGVDDPEYALLKFTARDAKIFMENVFDYIEI